MFNAVRHYVYSTKTRFSGLYQPHYTEQHCIAIAILKTAGARIKFFTNFFSIFLKFFCLYIIRYKRRVL